MQMIGAAFGATIVGARRIMHGKSSAIFHDGRDIFREVPVPFSAIRYHSLVIERASLKAKLAACEEAIDKLSQEKGAAQLNLAKAKHDGGASLEEAALESARLRFRPILMTAFAFILGVVPLLIAGGAAPPASRPSAQWSSAALR
jgi:arsenate reductase-like glutaredoxin family protein